MVPRLPNICKNHILVTAMNSKNNIIPSGGPSPYLYIYIYIYIYIIYILYIYIWMHIAQTLRNSTSENLRVWYVCHFKFVWRTVYVWGHFNRSLCDSKSTWHIIDGRNSYIYIYIYIYILRPCSVCAAYFEVKKSNNYSEINSYITQIWVIYELIQTDLYVQLS